MKIDKISFLHDKLHSWYDKYIDVVNDMCEDNGIEKLDLSKTKMTLKDKSSLFDYFLKKLINFFLTLNPLLFCFSYSSKKCCKYSKPFM